VNISQCTLNVFCEVIICAGIDTVELYYKIIKGTEYFVTLRTSIVTNEEYNVMVNSKESTLRSLTLYIYGAPILDVSRSHTTTQHSR